MSKRSNGEGTVYQRKDGRWCGAYFDEGFHRHYVYGRTQKETKEKLKQKMTESKTERLDRTEDAHYTLLNWIYEYLEEYKKNELKISTYSSYLEVCRYHIEGTELESIPLEKITADTLQQYYNRKIKDGYNSKTVRHIMVIINSALEMAVKLKMLSENPNRYTTLPKKTQFETKVLSKNEVNRIVTQAKNEEYYPIIVTTIFTGMRKGEIMALQWKNVDFNNRRIHVKYSACKVTSAEADERGHHKTTYHILEPKTKTSIRTIPMLDEVYEALQLQKERQTVIKERNKDIYVDRDLVFANSTGGLQYDRRFMQKYHDLLRKYNITDVRFHDLRHTFASLLIEADVSMRVVQELLGHSSITTSMNIYAHVSDQKKVQALNELEKMRQGHNNIDH